MADYISNDTTLQEQTSRMYGIKYKKTNMYRVYGDDVNDDIRLEFDKPNKRWIVTSLNNNLWYNGKNYTRNQVVKSFNEGDGVIIKMMVQHTIEGSNLYDNYLYDVVGDQDSEIKYGATDIKYRVITNNIRLEAGLKVIKYENNLITETRTFTSQKIAKFKEWYGEEARYKVFNLVFDLNEGNWLCFSKSDYITYDNHPYQTNELIRSWSTRGTDVDFEIQDDCDKHRAKSFSKDTYPSVTVTTRIHESKVSDTVNRNNIVTNIAFDHKDAYYNGKHHKAMYLVYEDASVQGCWAKTFGKPKMLAITYAHPYWFLMTLKDGLVVNGVWKEAKSLLKVWKDGEEQIDITGSYTKYKRIPKAKNEKYDKIVYDILMSELDHSITVTKLFNNEAKNSRTITSADVRVKFENIEFVLSGQMWTIYSKCDFISYDSHTYRKDEPVLDFPIDDHFHIQINDNTNAYMVEDIFHYTAKSETLFSTTYRVWTSEIDRTIKIEKTCNNEVEPWETIRAYDVTYNTQYCDDLMIDFDYYSKKWCLASNSDTLYNEGVNVKKGEKIAEWNYYDNIKLDYITVSESNLSAVRLTQILINSTGKEYDTEDIDEPILYNETEMLKVCYSCTKGEWEVKSLNDYAWKGGVNYTTGMTILEFKDKAVFADTTIMFQLPEDGTIYDIDTHQPVNVINVMYTLYTTYDILHDITTLNVEQAGGSGVQFSSKVDKTNLSLLVDKEKGKSMYGYIWQRAAGPGPVPTQSRYLIVALYDTVTTNRSALCRLYVNDIERSIKRSGTTNSDFPYELDGKFFLYTILNQEYLFWTRYIGYLPDRVILQYGEDQYRIIYRENSQTISIHYGVLLENGIIVFKDISNNYLYKANYDVVFGDDICMINITNKEYLEYDATYLYFNNTFILSNNSFVCFKLDEFHTNFNVGFRYFNGQIESIDGNKEELDDLNSYLSNHYNFTQLASTFDTPCQYEESIVFHCSVGKTRHDPTEIPDDTWFGTVMAKYDISTNSFNYYDKFGIKESYTKLYSFQDKKYLATTGQFWTWFDQQSGTFSWGGDPNAYVYDVSSEENYMNLSESSRTYEREVDEEQMIPAVINPTIEVQRLDSEDSLTIGLFDGIEQNSMAVVIGPRYWEITDKLLLSKATSGSRRDLMIVMTNPYWEENSSNYAWSLDNYGIDADYN